MKFNTQPKQTSGVNLDQKNTESSALSYTETKYQSYFQAFWKPYTTAFISNIKKPKKDGEQKQKSDPNKQKQLEKDTKVNGINENSKKIGKTREFKESAPIHNLSKVDNTLCSEKKGAQAIKPSNQQVGGQIPYFDLDKEVNKNVNKLGSNTSAFAKDKKMQPIMNKAESEVKELSNLKETKLNPVTNQQRKVQSFKDQPKQVKQLKVVGNQEEFKHIQAQKPGDLQTEQVQATTELINETTELTYVKNEPINECVESQDIAFYQQKIDQIQNSSEFSLANQLSKASSIEIIDSNSTPDSNIHSSKISAENDKIEVNNSYESESKINTSVSVIIYPEIEKQDSEIQVDEQIYEKNIPAELQSVEINKNRSQMEGKISVLQESQSNSDDFVIQNAMLNKQVNEYATNFLSFLQKETMRLTEETAKIFSKKTQQNQNQLKKEGQNQGSMIQNCLEWAKIEIIPELTHQNISIIPEQGKKADESAGNPKDQLDVPNQTSAAEDKLDEQSEKNSSDQEDLKEKSEVEVEKAIIHSQLQNDASEK